MRRGSNDCLITNPVRVVKLILNSFSYTCIFPSFCTFAAFKKTKLLFKEKTLYMKSDIEIARSIELKKIKQVAESVGIPVKK